MRYELGNIDHYAIAVSGSVMENTPFFKATLDETVEPRKLYKAVRTAMNYHPLFKCKMSYDKGYFLEDNGNRRLRLFHTDTAGMPKEYGRRTNGYLFQICYFGKELSLEWCHAVTDGRGALRFLSTILEAHFGLPLPEVPKCFPLPLAFESIYDKKVRSFGQIKQPSGYRTGAMKMIPNGYKCTSHVLKVPTAEVMRVAKQADTTPAAILVPLFCRALRRHLPKKIRNRNVSCSIVVDCRKQMQLETMRNFYYGKVITYQDRFDAYDLPRLRL